MSDMTTNPPSRRRTIVVWSLTTITAALFAVGGVFKLAGAEQMVEAFAGYGFPPWFMTLVGLGELGGAIVLLVPQIAFIGGLGLMGIAGGAFITHMASGDPFGMAIGSIVFFILAAATTWMRGRDFARTATRVFGPS